MTIKAESTKEEIALKIKRSVSINPETLCWEFNGSTDTVGYGKIKLTKYKGKYKGIYGAHRLAYEAFINDIPAGMYVCHKCDVRICCNPDHLFLGTHQDNMDDMIRKGRFKPPPPQYGNKYTAKRVIANNIEYKSYTDAGKALGVSGNTIKKRINSNLNGYKAID